MLELRARLRDEAGEEPVPSLNDFFVKASALALLEHPRANGSYREEGFVLHTPVNVGLAVAASDALVVPTVRDASRTVARRPRRRDAPPREAVRAGTVTPHDLADGTFTVSNLGMFGMTAIAPSSTRRRPRSSASAAAARRSPWTTARWSPGSSRR